VTLGSGNLPTMIERMFGDAKGAESVGFSHGNLDLWLKPSTTINHEEGQYRSAWFADTRCRDACQPRWEAIVPEALEVFFEQIGADSLQVIVEPIAQPKLLWRSRVGFRLEDAPARLLEEGFVAILRDTAHIVECRIYLGYEVKTVEDSECLQALFPDHIQT
jgi:hypothetical protein